MKMLVAVLGLAVLCGSAGAQEKGTWRAANKPAKSITGDVAFAGEKFAINFMTYTIAEIRDLEPAEMAATFDLDAAANGSGHLYRLDIPATTKMLHKNTICGAEDTQWIVTFVSGKTLQMAMFSGEKMPVLTREGIAGTTNLCGTFAYVR